jgi:RNA polymerase sigma factor (sigma-70 family)
MDDVPVAPQPRSPGETFAYSDCDPLAPGASERLSLRALEGRGYAISDARLVLAIRAYHERGDSERCNALLQVLFERCKPMFRKMARGLINNREAFEDALQEMSLQLMSEALDPNEDFMTQNFAVYLRGLCVDNFQRTLRYEGRGYRTNDQGQIVSRPQHVPAPLMRSIDQPFAGDNEAADVIADPADEIEASLSNLHAHDILQQVPDRLDRTIIWLRVWMDMTWDEIAATCNMSERTMRGRFKRAIDDLRATLSQEERI